ncbi:putative DNA-directed RNA polymerase III subunit RPC4 [Helianthus annuus]|nr:putative DNA-directed RNA polymerase III subunit RPC4 [Helianthus annuus]
MDTDPPAPTPSSRKKLTKSSKKPKFTPKPPVQRRRLVLTKSDSSDDDSETEQEFLRTVIERLRSGGAKVEKKPSDNVTTSHGTGSSKTHEPPKKEGNSKSRYNLRETSGKKVTFSSATATKAEVTDHMLVDDESGSSTDSENEYKEPWDPYSNYPVSLPLRPVGSGNPEVLNVEEFGKHDEYDETKINSALELGLSGPDDGDKKQLIFFQFPEHLPLDQVPDSSKGKETAGSSTNASNKRVGLKDLPNGHIGKMLVYKSGAIKLKLGDIIFDVSSGTPCGSDQSAAMMDMESKDCCVLGKVNKRAVVTPDLNSMLDKINQL